MGKFTTFINTHFEGSGCRLIARAFDKCRQRRVKLYAVPGYWDVVGVSDGTDAWIAPASAGLFMETATGNCADLMRRLQAGDELPPVPEWPDSPKRGRVALEDDEEPKPRPTKPRARVSLEEDEPTTPRRTRRAILA